MASPAAAQSSHLSTDKVAQDIAQDYSNQWHILEQLKSSVAVVDPFAETNRTPAPNSFPNTETAEDSEKNKADDKEWYVLNDAVSSGHASDAGSDSALEISDLRLNAGDVSYNSKVTSNSTLQPNNGQLVKDPLYQEQWHALEELKESVKAMQWRSPTPDTPLDVSEHRRDTSARGQSQKNGFTEPHKRTPSGSGNLTSSSIASSSNTSIESGVQTGRSSNLPTSFPKSEMSLDVHHTDSITGLPVVAGVPPLANHQLENRNTSSDLSLESENLGFAELPHRPATIGNYCAGDTTAYLVNQSLNLNAQASQQDLSTQYTGTMSPVIGNPVVGNPVFLIPASGCESTLSKAPMSARERLQPDGRDGPDVKVAPPVPQGSNPALVGYPVSGGSSLNSPGTASQPSAGSAILGNNMSNSSNFPNSLLVTGTEPLAQNMTAYDMTGIQSGSGSHSGSLQTENEARESNTNLENFKGAQHYSSLPWQPPSSDVYTSSLQGVSDNGTSFSWLSADVSPTDAPIDLPKDVSSKSRSQEELREAVLQRIEAHTQIPGLTSNQEPRDLTNISYLDNRPSLSDSGLWSARYLGNGQEIQPSSMQTFFPHTRQDSTAFRDLSSRESTPQEHLQRPLLSISNLVLTTQPEQSTLSTNTSFSTTSAPVSVGQDNFSWSSQGLATSWADSIVPTKDVSVKPSSVLSSRPSALDNIRSTLVNTDAQSPVSKLLGPNFKATQDYLSKLKTERVLDSSGESTASSLKDGQVVTRLVDQHSSGSVSLLSDRGYQARKEAWIIKENDPLSNSITADEKSTTSGNEIIVSQNDANGNNSKTEKHPPISHLTEDASALIGSKDRNSFREVPESTGSTSFRLPNTSAYTPSYVPTSVTPSSYALSNSSKQSQGFYSGSCNSNESHASIRDGLWPNSSNYELRHVSQTRATGTPPSSGGHDARRVNEIPTNVSNNSRTSDVSTGGTKERDQISSQYSSISNYETPLTALGSDKRSWSQEAGGKVLNLRYSAGSDATFHDEAEDTDNLLSYEAVLEGDIKYFKNLKHDTGKGNFHSSSINSRTEKLTPSHLTGDISSINGTTDRDPSRIPASSGSTGLDFTNSDEQMQRYHLSLGAGEVRPVKVEENCRETHRKPVDTKESDTELSSDALEVDEYEEDQTKEEGFSSDRNTTPATESSSSSMYQPYLPIALRQPPSTERDSELTANSSSTYGVYDIRLSSGPGSTNRRRKAMGLSPIPGRVPKPSNGVVYVSGDSSPHSTRDEVSTDDGFKDDTRDETLKDDEEETPVHMSLHEHGTERRRTNSRGSRNSRHSEEEREAHRQRSSSSKEGSFRSRSRASSLEEAKMIDDYIGGRKTVQHTKPRQKTKGISRDVSHSDESHSSRGSSTKDTDLNQMWQRFQESLKSSPRSKKDDSVSSHLSRLSTLLSKPIDVITTSSETEVEQYRKHRSHSYASSSSDVSTESEQPYQPSNEHSITRQIQLRKLLETVNIADIPAFPRLRHRDTTTTNSSTLSDTSTSEAPLAPPRAGVTRSNRVSRKVSKTPVLEPFVQTKPRSAELNTARRPKCICAINTAHKPTALEPNPGEHHNEKKKQLVEKKTQRPRTFEVGVNFPSPKISREKKATRSKKEYVDVAVQTKTAANHDEGVSLRAKSESIKPRVKKSDEDKSSRSTRATSSPRRSERCIVSLDSPGDLSHRTVPSPKQKERHIASQNSTRDQDHVISSNGWDESNASTHTPRKDGKPKGKHHKGRSLPNSKSTTEVSLDSSSPVWFYPVSNRHYSRPNPPPSVLPGTLRFEEQTLKTYSPPAAPPSSSMQKLSLQEAFHFAKPDFVKRSRARLSRIERNRHVRENGEVNAMGEERVSKMEIPASKPNANKTQSEKKTERLRPKPRQLSKKEIKTLNLKLYNNLPEVKAKKEDNRRANFYKTNRLRAKLFDKRVRETLKKRYSA